MSIRKSNWSDFASAFAMSARESVRRLLESAIMNARAVISAMKTALLVNINIIFPSEKSGSHFHRLYRIIWEHPLQSSVSGCQRDEGVQQGTKYLYIRITLHDLFDPCEWQRGVSIIRCFLLSSIDLSLPERTEELVEWFTRLDIRC